ncbi:hypothetical protein D3C87_2028040 [compost metagenome]
MIIEVEIAAEGRNPWEAPAEPLPVSLDLGERCARNGGEGHVAMVEMNRDAVEIVGPERAVLAPLLPVRTQHEVVDD